MDARVYCTTETSAPQAIKLLIRAPCLLHACVHVLEAFLLLLNFRTNADRTA